MTTQHPDSARSPRLRRAFLGLAFAMAVAALVGAAVVPAGAATAVNGFSPGSGPAGTVVTISGTELAGATGVTFNGTSAAFSVTSATRVRAVVPCGATTGKVAVTTTGGTVESAGDFTVTAPAPTISSFSPTAGGVGTSVRIVGTNFRCVTGVQFNGTAAAYSVSPPNRIVATVPAGATTGRISVTAAGGTVQSAGDFTLLGGPEITALTPTSGLPRSTVAITGTNLTGATAVTFNGTSATFTVASATQINAVVPCGATTGTVAVTTPSGSANSTGPFTVAALPAPTVTGSTPTSSAIGSVVTITGTDLTCTTAVEFNGVAAPFSVVSGTQVRATVPSGATTGRIGVTTTSGSALSAADFTVLAPTVASFSPASGGVGSLVVISGSGFVGVTAVAVNGTAMTNVAVVSATKIVARVGIGSTTGPITVTTAGGTATSVGAFTVPAPTVKGFTPASGAVGATVTISGTGFLGATAVTINGTAVTDLVVASGTKITAKVAAGTTSGAIAVTTPAGTGTSAATFTVG